MTSAHNSKPVSPEINEFCLSLLERLCKFKKVSQVHDKQREFLLSLFQNSVLTNKVLPAFLNEQERDDLINHMINALQHLFRVQEPNRISLFPQEPVLVISNPEYLDNAKLIPIDAELLLALTHSIQNKTPMERCEVV